MASASVRFANLAATPSRNVQFKGWNRFDQKAFEQANIWRQINAMGGLSLICPGHRYDSPPSVKMPPQGKRYAKIGSLLYNPILATGVDIPIPFQQGNLYVQAGYDGCIVSTVFQYTGTGFNEASGDLTWRISINQRYAKDYSKVVTQIGSLQTPYNINSGQILVQSGNWIQIWVNIAPGAVGNLTGGTILGAVFGWWWPR